MSQIKPIINITNNFVSGILFIIISLCILSCGCAYKYSDDDVENTKTWIYSKNIGKIIISKIKSRKVKRTRTYYPFIEYEYTVNGVKYVNNQIGRNLSITRKYVADEYIKKYQIDSNVDVIYNKINPSKSYLEYGNKRSIIWFIPPSCMLCTIGILAIISGFINR